MSFPFSFAALLAAGAAASAVAAQSGAIYPVAVQPDLLGYAVNADAFSVNCQVDGDIAPFGTVPYPYCRWYVGRWTQAGGGWVGSARLFQAFGLLVYSATHALRRFAMHPRQAT
jgi:hypothetical protein